MMIHLYTIFHEENRKMSFLHDELKFAATDSLEKFVAGSQLVIKTSIKFLLYISYRIWRNNLIDQLQLYKVKLCHCWGWFQILGGLKTI